MKANKFILPALAAGVGLMLAGRATAQTFTTLYNFSNGGDGGLPIAGLTLSGNTLYGTTYNGGSPQWGTVFAVNTDGTGFTTLYSFSGPDGAKPWAGVVLSDNTLYGTTRTGGSGAWGTVFAVNTDGTGFNTLYSFTPAADNNGIITNSDGTSPSCELVLSGNMLYGTASQGGPNGKGTVFAVNTDGTGFTNLHIFTATAGTNGLFGFGTNTDGGLPIAGLIQSGNTLYGTAAYGGTNGSGTVFAVNTDGTGFRTLHTFTATTGTSGASGYGTNSDGGAPLAGLILSGGTLFGTTALGGSSGNGTVFVVNTDGTSFSTLHSFTATYTNSDGLYTNSDGAGPVAGLISSGSTLYGTAQTGGSSGDGTAFAVNTDGTGFTNFYSFTARTGPPVANSDGAFPRAVLVLAGNTLYGTASRGGNSDAGTVFSLSLPAVSAPQLAISASGTNVVLTWPAAATGFTLQSTTNLGSSAIWSTNSPAPVLVNGQNVVTNPISGTQQFFRLIQ